MEVNQTHPVKLVFCELLIQTFVKGDCHSAEMNEMKPLNRKTRNKWLLLYTLINNPTLKKERKHYRKVNDVKLETLGDYLRRRASSKRKGNEVGSLRKESAESATQPSEL